jgi:colicin import membrane protein
MGAALIHDQLLPRAPGGNAPGAVLAVVVHAGLVAALTLGVDWRTHSPEMVSAELWAAVPQSAAPPPPPVVEPPAPTPAPVPAPAPPPVARTEPPPPPPDIALERERKKAEAERKKAELEAEQKAERQRADEKKKADDERKKRELAEERRAADKLAAEKAEDDRLAKQREENLRRMMGQAGATPGTTGTTGSAAQNAAPSATYAGKVKAAVRPNIVFTGMAEFNAAAEVEVSSAPGGSIISRRLIKSSGYKDWDEAVLRAIDKTRSLPRDTDGRVPALLIISFRPNE